MQVHWDRKGKKKVFLGKNKKISQFSSFCKQAFLYEDKQVERQVSLYEMESGLYQKILQVPAVESFGASTEVLLCVQQHPQPSLLSIGSFGFWPA